ncbi:MAG: SurA N-terminal domain-containing protein [Prevotella sp.]|nr:SurA N-terminal domain-containing protein [Prevotella sp.]
MAALGSIRKRGVTLIVIVGLALFAFIAEEFFRSCETQRNQRSQQVGQILGENISVQDFQSLMDETQEMMKLTQGRDNLSEDEMNRVKDQVWNTLVSSRIIQDEAGKLGLTVTDDELRDVLRTGTHQMLRSTPFVNQQTGRFDVQMLTKFQDEYKKAQASGNAQALEQMQTVMRYWQYTEKQLRQQLLGEKYQVLLSQCLLSNPVSAKMAFEGQNTEADIQLASLAYTTVNDKDVSVSDADLKAKYGEQKEMFKQQVETRDIKYVDFRVLPSAADRQALMSQMKQAEAQLREGSAQPGEVVRKAQSDVAYLGLPVMSSSLPYNIRQRVDSLAVGQTTAPFETSEAEGNVAYNVVKLISKAQLPDSVEYRIIQVGGETADAAKKTADSIIAAVRGGAPFDTIAAKYSQQGAKQWMTTAMYQTANNIDPDSRSYINALNTMQTGEMRSLDLSMGGNLVVQVTDRRHFIDKIDVAVVKHVVEISKDTYSAAYNKFSQYVSENQTIESLEQNASKYGFQVRERQDMFNSEHNVAGVRGTREAMKWIFDAKENEVSPLYECGSNDHLMVIALTKIHPVGYRDWESVREQLTQEVLRDKKFDLLAKKLGGVKSLAEAQQKGARVDSVSHVTSAPVFVQATGASEPVLSGVVAKAKAGEFVPEVVKGNAAAYMVKVNAKTQGAGKLDEKAQEARLRQQAMQAVGRFMQELYQKANVADNRYRFF